MTVIALNWNTFLQCLLCCISIVTISEAVDVKLDAATQHHVLGGRTKFLYNSTWPADHGDVSRSKYSLNAGLPRNFDSKDLKTITQPSVKSPQWIYTQGEKSKYIFMLGGPRVTSTSISKLNSITLEVLQTYALPASLYLGGLLMHKNGHVYCIHANVLYLFYYGDLTNMTSVRLPSRLNGGIIQTNGMLVTQDGYLVVKQWSTILDDILFYTSALPVLNTIFISIIVATVLAFVFLSPKETSSVVAALFGLVVGAVIVFTVIVISMYSVTKLPFDPFRLIYEGSLFSTSTSIASAAGGGELKFIDPISLQIVAEAVLPERCSIARMSMVAVKNVMSGENEDALILLGDELAYQFRWRPSSRSIHHHRSWTRRYRRTGDGSYQATGASIFNNSAYYTDNTFPVHLSGQSYRMFRSLLTPEKLDVEGHPFDVTIRGDDTPNSYKNQLKHAKQYYNDARINAPTEYGVQLTSTVPGFMFWSVVVSPVVGDIITWDTVGKVVESRNLVNMSIHWSVKAWNADCLTVAADKNHVYLSDYSLGPPTSQEWLPVLGSTAKGSRYEFVDKFFIVVNAETGDILANITIGKQQGIRLSMIVPGANNDVIIGTNDGLVRVYVDK